MALEGRSKLHPSIFPLLQVLEFENFRKEYENIQESVDEQFLAKVNERMGKKLMEGTEYLLSPSRNFPFFLAPVSGRPFERNKGFIRGHYLHQQ